MIPNDKYQQKYRIPSNLLQNWDYRWAGAYFITICTQNREHYFGNIENGEMKLSPVGTIADVMWHEIKNHLKNIELDAFVVMPNHIHGILIINGNDTQNQDGMGNENNVNNVDDVDNMDNVDNVNNVIIVNNVDNVETGHALSLRRQRQQRQQSNKTIGQNRFQHIWKNSVSSIIGSYKSAVTKHAHRLGFVFAWQSRFYDHIVRNERSYNHIIHYIQNNIANWEHDSLHTV